MPKLNTYPILNSIRDADILPLGTPIGNTRSDAPAGIFLVSFAKFKELLGLSSFTQAERDVLDGASQVSSINLSGRDITFASSGGNVATITVPGVTVLDEGSRQGAEYEIDQLNFIGAGVTARNVGRRADITITGGGGGGSSTGGGGGGASLGAAQTATFQIPTVAAQTLTIATPGMPVFYNIDMLTGTGLSGILTPSVVSGVARVTAGAAGYVNLVWQDEVQIDSTNVGTGSDGEFVWVISQYDSSGASKRSWVAEHGISDPISRALTFPIEINTGLTPIEAGDYFTFNFAFNCPQAAKRLVFQLPADNPGLDERIEFIYFSVDDVFQEGTALPDPASGPKLFYLTQRIPGRRAVAGRPEIPAVYGPATRGTGARQDANLVAAGDEGDRDRSIGWGSFPADGGGSYQNQGSIDQNLNGLAEIIEFDHTFGASDIDINVSWAKAQNSLYSKFFTNGARMYVDGNLLTTFSGGSRRDNYGDDNYYTFVIRDFGRNFFEGLNSRHTVNFQAADNEWLFRAGWARGNLISAAVPAVEAVPGIPDKPAGLYQIINRAYVRVGDGAAGPPGLSGRGVPTGGSSGQVLAKSSATDYDTEWVNQASGGGSQSPAGPFLALASEPEDFSSYADNQILRINSPGPGKWLEVRPQTNWGHGIKAVVSQYGSANNRGFNLVGSDTTSTAITAIDGEDNLANSPVKRISFQRIPASGPITAANIEVLIEKEALSETDQARSSIWMRVYNGAPSATTDVSTAQMTKGSDETFNDVVCQKYTASGDFLNASNNSYTNVETWSSSYANALYFTFYTADPPDTEAGQNDNPLNFLPEKLGIEIDPPLTALDTEPADFTGFADGQILRISEPAPGKWLEVEKLTDFGHGLLMNATLETEGSVQNRGARVVGTGQHGSFATVEGGAFTAAESPIGSFEFQFDPGGAGTSDDTYTAQGLIKKSDIPVANQSVGTVYFAYYNAIPSENSFIDVLPLVKQSGETELNGQAYFEYSLASTQSRYNTFRDAMTQATTPIYFELYKAFSTYSNRGEVFDVLKEKVANEIDPPGGADDAEAIKDKLESLTSNARLDASAIKNIPNQDIPSRTTIPSVTPITGKYPEITVGRESGSFRDHYGYNNMPLAGQASSSFGSKDDELLYIAGIFGTLSSSIVVITPKRQSASSSETEDEIFLRSQRSIIIGDTEYGLGTWNAGNSGRGGYRNVVPLNQGQQRPTPSSLGFANSGTKFEINFKNAAGVLAYARIGAYTPPQRFILAKTIPAKELPYIDAVRQSDGSYSFQIPSEFFGSSNSNRRGSNIGSKSQSLTDIINVHLNSSSASNAFSFIGSPIGDAAAFTRLSANTLISLNGVDFGLGAAQAELPNNQGPLLYILPLADRGSSSRANAGGTLRNFVQGLTESTERIRIQLKNAQNVNFYSANPEYRAGEYHLILGAYVRLDTGLDETAFNVSPADPNKDLKFIVQEVTGSMQADKDLAFVGVGSGATRRFTIPNPFPGINRISFYASTYGATTEDQTLRNRFSVEVPLAGFVDEKAPKALKLDANTYPLSYWETDSGIAIYRSSVVANASRLAADGNIEDVNVQLLDDSWAGVSDVQRSVKSVDKPELQALANSPSGVHVPPENPREGQRIKMLNDYTIRGGTVVTAAEPASGQAGHGLYSGYLKASGRTGGLPDLGETTLTATNFTGLLSYSSAEGNSAGFRDKLVFQSPAAYTPSKVWVNDKEAATAQVTGVGAGYWAITGYNGATLSPGRRLKFNAERSGSNLFPDIVLETGVEYIWDGIQWIRTEVGLTEGQVDARITGAVAAFALKAPARTGQAFIPAGFWAGTQAQYNAITAKGANTIYFVI